ncbi:MAG TPA: amidohydrolase family protein [Candidatus Limnocylindrales bacterium]|nr:amidohydrolase family protein [Candidatus Limnocylindrales bacterium]
MSVLLTGGAVVRSLDPPRVELTDLLLADGRVADRSAAGAEAGRAERIDCSGCLIIPGNVCAHTHAYSALARGMPYRLPAPASFLEILQRVWWRLDRALDPESIRASALVAAHEALLAGTTTLIDHHASPNAIDGSLDIVAEAFEEAGIRSVMCYETSDRDGPQRAQEGVEENRRFLDRVAGGRWPLARGMVGAHASFTLSDETLVDCVALARDHRTGIHLHLAEDAVDQADALARFGKRATLRLHALGGLDDRSLLAHAVHIDPSEAELLTAARATVAHNPRSNMNNGVGRTPLGWLVGSVALGTDGIGADMFEESRVAYLRSREEELSTVPALALRLLARGAAVVGARFGEPALGRLEAGAPADLAVLAHDAPTPLEADGLAGHWVFGLGAGAVRDVMVAGEMVVRNGRSTRLDAAEIAVEARHAAGRLWERLDSIGPHPFTPSRLLATAGGS